MITIKELKEAFKSMPKDKLLSYGLGKPFSWRGGYSEVAFPIVEKITVEEQEKNINQALTDTFYGYKGGEYHYDDNTLVNFEEGYSDYTDGNYLAQFLYPEVVKDMDPLFAWVLMRSV